MQEQAPCHEMALENRGFGDNGVLQLFQLHNLAV